MRKMKCLIRFLLVALSLVMFSTSVLAENTTQIDEWDDEWIDDINLLEAYDQFYENGFGEDEFIMLIRDILGYVPKIYAFTKEDGNSFMGLKLPDKDIEFPIQVDGHGIHFNETEYMQVVLEENLAQYGYEFYTRPGESWYEFEEERLISSSLGTLATYFKLIQDAEGNFFISCYDEILRLYEDDFYVIDEYHTLVSGEVLSQALYNWNMKN
ncbi:MAG: hypothetical protein IJ215_03645 [Clostridia bacterium]|nr:hypothetical protein [Clostridia bacterium]